MTHEHKALARQVTEAHNRRDLMQIDELLAADFVAHIADWPQPLTREQYLQGAKNAHEAFTNLMFFIEDMIAEDDKVVLRVTARGMHTGIYQGITPTGREVEFTGITIRRIVAGKIVEEWQSNDHLTLLRQLGAVPK